MDQTQLNNQLIEASKRGELDMVKKLIQEGTNVNHADNNNGYTPLIFASLSEHLEIVKYLAEHGANVNQADNIGTTPLIWASRAGHLEIVKYLVEHGANVNYATNYGYTPLIMASETIHFEVIKYLVEHGANLNHSTNNGNTPLIFASQYGHLEIVKYLVEHGANVNQASMNGDTPLIWANRYGWDDIVKYLVSRGADYTTIYDTIRNQPIFQDIIKDQTNKLKNELTERYGLVKHIPNLPKDAILKTIYEVPYQQYCNPPGNGLPPIQLIALANILNNTMPKKRGLIEEGGKFEYIDLHLSWKELCDKVKAALYLLL